MGIPGLLKEIGKGERVALSKLAIDHFEKHKRPLRIAIDAAIWNFQTQSGQGGKNPALRTLFFRLLKLLALPIHPVFVYDGRNKPLTKRGKTVSRYGTCVPNELSRNLVARFQFPHHTAPGEAEAECAVLQKFGVVDAVMSQDADALMFGSTVTLRDWSKEGTKGNKTPTHVNLLEEARIKDVSGLDASGMILVALLSGGDYHDGVPGFGPALSCQIARAGFGQELVTVMQDSDLKGIDEWRERLNYELATNESGYFLKRHRTLKVPEDFPNRTILSYYLNPAVSKKEDLPRLEARWMQWWDEKIDIPALRQYTVMTFDWLYKEGARKFVRRLAQPLFQRRLITRSVQPQDSSGSEITGSRRHFVNDGVPELRFSAVPASIVGIDFEAEEDNPGNADIELDEELDEAQQAIQEAGRDATNSLQSPCKPNELPRWDPFVSERWWVLEPLLRIGLPHLVEKWRQTQTIPRGRSTKDTSEPCNPAAKASRSRKIDQSMKDGAIETFLPATTCRSSNPPARRRKPLERAKTDTALLKVSHTANIDSFFKPSKFSETVHKSQCELIHLDSEPHRRLNNDESDDGIDVDLARLLGKCSISRMLLLDCTEGEHDIPDAASSPTVTQRKRRPERHHLDQRKADGEDKQEGLEEEFLPPIASFFGPRNKVLTGDPSRHQRPMNGEPEERPVQDVKLHKKTHDSSEEANEKAEHRAPVSQANRVAESVQTDNDSACTRALAGIEDAATRRICRGLPMIRESLPGTWKEIPLTPSQSSGVAFIDLTNS